jgi:FHA domain/Abnormal spindle-like microcephaly-assoc'd, ASPM-SPD-2-Hydin
MSDRRFDRPKVPQATSAVTSSYRPAAVLTVIAPPTQAGRLVAVDPHGTIIGRAATCDLMLASEHVSREHAVVRVHDGEYAVEDLGSKNGTLLNGQRLTGQQRLRDGDRLSFADVAVEFQLSGTRQIPPEPSQPPPGDPWHPEDPTKPLRRVQSLRSELRDAPGFSSGALLLAILGSVVGTVLTTAAGRGHWGSLAGAAIGPVVSTVFSRKLAGEKGRIRTAAVIILSAGALIITVTGISLTEKAVGKSVIPGASEGGTFIPEETDGPAPPPPKKPPPGDPGIEVASVDCGSVPVGTTNSCSTPIKSVGTEPLHITSVEMTDGDNAEFDISEKCVGEWVAAGDSCELTVDFTPSAADQRTATIVIHQNLPSPDRGTEVQLTGTGIDTHSGEATLTVVIDSSEATGTVFSDSGGIACPDACSATFDSGASVVLSATYDQGAGSVEWDSCDSIEGESCAVQLDEDRTVSARLRP